LQYFLDTIKMMMLVHQEEDVFQ